MAKRYLDKDPFTGIDSYHDYDDDKGITYIQQVQDVEPILERTKALSNTSHSKDGIKRNWWHAAIIPNIVIEKWLQEGVNFYNKDHWPAVKRKLNDPEWRYLRTGSGKL
jgi:hypothetical protein